MGDAVRTDGGLIVEVRDRVAYATLDRPERLNALSVALTSDLVDAFDSFSTDPGIWAVLLTSTGERAFSAGADLKDMGEADARRADVDRRRPRVAARPQGWQRSHDRIASQLLRGHPRVREADRRSDVRLGHGWRL